MPQCVLPYNNGPDANDAQVKRSVEHGVRKQLLVSCDVEIVG